MKNLTDDAEFDVGVGGAAPAVVDAAAVLVVVVVDDRVDLERGGMRGEVEDGAAAEEGVVGEVLRLRQRPVARVDAVDGRLGAVAVPEDQRHRVAARRHRDVARQLRPAADYRSNTRVN